MYVIDESSYRVDKTNFPTLEEAQQKAGEAARILNRPINIYQLSAGELNFSVRVMPDGGIEHENPLTDPGPTDTIGPVMPALGKIQVLDEVAEVLERAGQTSLAAKVDAEAHRIRKAPRGVAAVAYRLKENSSKKRPVKAAAPGVTIIEQMLREWPKVEKMIESGDVEGAKKQLGLWQHAYFYAPGLNEHVIPLSDTGAASEISFMLEKMTDPESAKKALKSYGDRILSEWEKVVKKYSWQKGMTAEKIRRESESIWNEASQKGGEKLASKAIDVFFEKGPDAARKIIEKAKPKP